MTLSRTRLFLVLLFVAACGTGCAGRTNDHVWRPIAAWAMATRIGTGIAESNWLFAVIESFHLTGLALLGGAVILVDFRLLGLGLSDESPTKLSRSAEPWLFTGLGITVTSGLLLFLSEATKFYSAGFWDSAEAPFIYKMLFLLLAVAFTFTVRRKLLHNIETLPTRAPMRARLVGLTSLILWLLVGVSGRAIGFY